MGSPQNDDGELFLRFRTGDLDALEALHRLHSRALYVFALSLTGNPAEAEDLVQEAFLRLIERDPGHPPRRIRPFLFALVRNAACDATRRARRQRNSIHLSVPAGASNNLPRPLLEGIAQAVSAALAGLPEEQRQVVLLKVYGELTLAQIADLLDLPIGTVASRYRYGTGKLGEVLRKELQP